MRPLWDVTTRGAGVPAPRVIQSDLYRVSVFRGKLHPINEIVSLQNSIRSSPPSLRRHAGCD